ncbi:MAG: chromosomal replication initiator protein DnaA, partial [Phycisphaerae bacterium]|nr:chromosomal replication initiator protein DnaA [Phycisphaerae bacterium]
MPVPDPSLWRNVLAHLRRNHGEICRHWFEELEPVQLEGGSLDVRVHNDIQRNYLTKRCSQAFNDAAQSATGALVAVRFVDSGEAPVPVVRPVVGAAASAPPPSRSTDPIYRFDVGDDEIVLSPDYCFENFVTGPNNQLAYAAAVAVSEQPGRAYNPLFIHGGVGLGKTHLLQAICQTVLQANPAAQICYLSCDTFMHHFLESVQSGQMSEFRNRYRHMDLLLIDDIHFLANRERTQEEFFHTFNTLYQANKQIVLSSDSPPNEIPQLEERLTSRFNWGLVARVDQPTFETRVAILSKKAQLRGIDLPEEVACHIAEKVDTNIRELEGAITKIQSMSMLQQRPIDLDLARIALGEQNFENQAQLTIQNVIDAVTDYFDVKLADLQSKRRHRSITIPRQICMYLARKRTRYSLEEIGGYFG